MKLTLTMAQHSSIFAALQAFDGYKKIVTDTNGAEKQVDATYALTPAVRWAIAKNLAALDPSQKSLNIARNAIVKNLSNGEMSVPKDKMGEFSEALNQILDREETIEYEGFSYEDLKPETNPIPPSVIAALIPILTKPVEAKG